MANDYNVKEAEAQNLHKRITKADDILNSPLIKILTLMGSGGVGAGMLHNYGKEGDLASKFYKSILKLQGQGEGAGLGEIAGKMAGNVGSVGAMKA